VGFPGETDGDHAATMALVDALPFTYLHVFPYSERAEAAAHRLGPPEPPAVVRARSADLRALADAKAASYRAARDGGQADVVLLRRAGGWHEGLTGDYLPVRVATTQAVGTRLNASLRLLADGTLQAVPVEPAA
jgi:threonylcarbamoyladenosine tRNA methylthiotransferase MtaB